MRRSAGLGRRAWVDDMRRLDMFTARHPILSMIIGYLLLLAFALMFLPSDPGDMRQTAYKERT
jgi:hypothetical protein